MLEVIYLVFNEGHLATAGASLTRPELCEDALRIARVLAGLMPDEPEVHGLVALLEVSASRLAARIDRDGAPVLLADQDRALWDRGLVRRGPLARANELVATRGAPARSYQLQAAIAAHHARAATAEATEWPRIAALYSLLAERAPSPIVELNRAAAVAVAMALGPDAGRELVEALVADGALAAYHLLPAVRGDLLAKLGRGDEARAEFQRAAELTRNQREPEALLARARDLAVRASAPLIPDVRAIKQ